MGITLTEEQLETITNRLKPKDYKRFVERIENLQGDIDAVDAQAKLDKAPIREDMAEVYKEADESGLDKKALKAVISKRRKLKKAHATFDKLDISEKSNALTIEAALGPFIDTPLGQAAAQA